MTCTR